MLSTAEGMLGPYVWGVYDLLVLPPSFPYGGMENPCLTFVTPTCIVSSYSCMICTVAALLLLLSICIAFISQKPKCWLNNSRSWGICTDAWCCCVVWWSFFGIRCCTWDHTQLDGEPGDKQQLGTLLVCTVCMLHSEALILHVHVITQVTY